ncbi:MAG: hypothetical protein JXB17_07850 [Bacteroidales bacterium]|nr:hypothetical protein [Bacteroidales bacterium]
MRGIEIKRFINFLLIIVITGLLFPCKSNPTSFDIIIAADSAGDFIKPLVVKNREIKSTIASIEERKIDKIVIFDTKPIK